MKRISKKAILSLLMILTMLFGIVGCNFYAGGGSKESTPTLEPVTYPLTVTELDNNVTIEAEPERVVSCAPNITELIYKLGAQDKIVGRTDFSLQKN